MVTIVSIQNKLEVLPGNIILLPGCEPTSAFTSPTLSNNLDCNSSYITLSDALSIIPNAKVVSIYNTRVKVRYFVLPSGPPPTPQDCTNCSTRFDWYKILRDNATPITNDIDVQNAGVNCLDRICELFSIQNKCDIL